MTTTRAQALEVARELLQEGEDDDPDYEEEVETESTAPTRVMTRNRPTATTTIPERPRRRMRISTNLSSLPPPLIVNRHSPYPFGTPPDSPIATDADKAGADDDSDIYAEANQFELGCSICRENHPVSMLIMPLCGHPICHTCITKLSKYSAPESMHYMNCPQCRAIFTIRDSYPMDCVSHKGCCDQKLTCTRVLFLTPCGRIVCSYCVEERTMMAKKSGKGLVIKCVCGSEGFHRVRLLQKMHPCSWATY